MIIFDGKELAGSMEHKLAARVSELRSQGEQPSIAAILFKEDAGSQLYTGLKKEAATRVGIEYQVFEHSLSEDPLSVIKTIQKVAADQAVTGIIIQKPWRKTWIEQGSGALSTNAQDQKKAFDNWWHSLVSQIPLEKDVDGLHPITLQAIKDGIWREQERVLPATCQAVLTIMYAADALKSRPKIVIVGKSDLLGRPLYYELRNQGHEAELLGTDEFKARIASGQKLLDADVVVSATGRVHLITGDLVKKGVKIIDVGEPQPDVDLESVRSVASFITPVPGGVGPLTVVCLLENALQLLG